MFQIKLSGPESEFLQRNLIALVRESKSTLPSITSIIFLTLQSSFNKNSTTSSIMDLRSPSIFIFTATNSTVASRQEDESFHPSHKQDQAAS